MTDVILTLNAGSSSSKCSLFASLRERETLSLLYRAGVEGLGNEPPVRISAATGQQQEDERLTANAAMHHEEALSVLLEWIEQHEDGLTLLAVGHRVVHGGRLFSAPVLVDATVLAQLEQSVPLAPLHQPHNLAAIRALARINPAVPQIACFDTAFHHTQPAIAQIFALPREVMALGVKRYGFHGLSYEYIASVLPHYMGASGATRACRCQAPADSCRWRGQQPLHHWRHRGFVTGPRGSWSLPTVRCRCASEPRQWEGWCSRWEWPRQP